MTCFDDKSRACHPERARTPQIRSDSLYDCHPERGRRSAATEGESKDPYPAGSMNAADSLFGPRRLRRDLDRPLLLLLVVAIFSIPLPAQDTGRTVRKQRIEVTEPGTSPAVSNAEAAIERKDYPRAEQLLQQAVQQNPKDYQAWFDLAFVQNATGRTADSIASYRKSVEANPRVFESNLNLGLMLARANDPDAEKFLRAATELKPSARPEEGLERAWLSLGHVLEAKNPPAALDAFRRAAQLQPRDPEPHLSAALVAQKRGDLAAAADEFESAARLDPKSAEAVAGLANVYMQSSRLPDAEAALRQYLALEPGNPTAHLQLGRVLVAQGKSDDAIPEFEAAGSADPAARRDLAELYVRVKQYPKAEALYRALLQQAPRDRDLRVALGSVLMEQKRFPEAQKMLLAAVDLQNAQSSGADPKAGLGLAYEKLAVAANENKDYVTTLNALKARADYLPETAFTCFLRATAFDNLKVVKQAADNYRRFLELSNGKYPDQEFQARHRLLALEPKK